MMAFFLPFLFPFLRIALDAHPSIVISSVRCRKMARWLVLIATVSTVFAATISNAASKVPQRSSLTRPSSRISTRINVILPLSTNRRQRTRPGQFSRGWGLAPTQRCLTPHVNQEINDAVKEDAKVKMEPQQFYHVL